MKKSSFTIIEEVYEGHGDVFTVLGKSRSGKATIAPYIVAFCSRHEDELSDVQRFMDLESAEERFAEIAYEQEQPDESMAFLEDFQQDTVYEWEDIFIRPHSKPVKRAEVKALIERVCDDYNMRIPRLIWTKPQEYSYYDEDKHAIYFGHRDYCTALHEIAHAIMAEKLDGPDDHANHCPQF